MCQKICDHSKVLCGISYLSGLVQHSANIQKRSIGAPDVLLHSVNELVHDQCNGSRIAILSVPYPSIFGMNLVHQLSQTALSEN